MRVPRAEVRGDDPPRPALIPRLEDLDANVALEGGVVEVSLAGQTEGGLGRIELLSLDPNAVQPCIG